MAKGINTQVAVIVLVLVSVFALSQVGKKNVETDYVDILMDNQGKDIGSKDEGTIIMMTKLDLNNIFINPAQRLRYVVLFSSAVMNGFEIKYNFIDSTLEAGLPLIKGETISILDNNMHQIGYTYKKDIGQELYLDGIKIASGMFTGVKETVPIGMVVLDVNEQVVEMGSEVGYISRALTEEEIKEIFNNAR